MMVGMMVHVVAMMDSTEAHILLVHLINKQQVLYVIEYFHVKPSRLLSLRHFWVKPNSSVAALPRRVEIDR